MFKIHENGDGTTDVFCNKTGKLICTIGGHQRNMGLGCRPVESSPKPRSCCYNLDLKSECESKIKCASDIEEQSTREKICDNTPDEPKDDFFNDCVTHDQFARCLNLVPKEKLKTEPSDQLKSTFPLRQISRTKESLVQDDVRDTKFYDHMPLFSCLGIKMLNLNKQKNFYSDQTIDMKIKHYDSFCRFQLNTLSQYSNFPKLRCREKKEYPLCITQRILQYTDTHMYAFNRRQRLEKLITYRTGLNTQSRRLLLKCNKRLAVPLKRLTPEEIDKWPHKRSRIGEITADDIKAEESSFMGSNSILPVIELDSPIYVDLEMCSSDSEESSDESTDPSFRYSLKRELNSSNSALSSLKHNNRHYTKLLKKHQNYNNCCVKAKNILGRIQNCFGDYYVAGTNIRIPFYKDFLDSLDQKVLSGVLIPENNHLKDSLYDHAYHRPFSQEAYENELLNSKRLIQKSSPSKIKDLLKKKNCIKSKSKFNSVKNSNSLKRAVNKTVSKIEVPVIDLTNDSSDVERESNSSWQFHCYGCGCNVVSRGQSAAYSVAAHHLKTFHCVSDIKSFLNVSNTHSGGFLEAFPGYKGAL